MSDGASTAPGSRGPLAPPVRVLLIGLAGAFVVWLLLRYGPAGPVRGVSAMVYLEHAVVTGLVGLGDLTGARSVSGLAWSVSANFAGLVTVLLVLVMAVLPWAVALRSDRAADRAFPDRASSGAGVRGSREVASTSSLPVTFVDDGSVRGGADGRAGTVVQTVGQLRAMAREAGIPWHTDYETEGGARAFLEVLRATQNGPSQVGRAGAETRTAPPVADPVIPPTDPSLQAAPDAHADAASRSEAGPDHSETGPEHSESTPEPTETAPTSTSSWSGSVYTPTSLYTSQSMGGRDEAASTSDADPADAYPADGAEDAR